MYEVGLYWVTDVLLFAQLMYLKVKALDSIDNRQNVVAGFKPAF